MTIMNDEVAKVKRERRERYMLRRQSASHKVKQAVVGATTEFVNTDFVKKNAQQLLDFENRPTTEEIAQQRYNQDVVHSNNIMKRRNTLLDEKRKLNLFYVSKPLFLAQKRAIYTEEANIKEKRKQIS